jgi:hypothetical protein
MLKHTIWSQFFKQPMNRLVINQFFIVCVSTEEKLNPPFRLSRKPLFPVKGVTVEDSMKIIMNASIRKPTFCLFFFIVVFNFYQGITSAKQVSPSYIWKGLDERTSNCLSLAWIQNW